MHEFSHTSCRDNKTKSTHIFMVCLLSFRNTSSDDPSFMPSNKQRKFIVFESLLLYSVPHNKHHCLSNFSRWDNGDRWASVQNVRKQMEVDESAESRRDSSWQPTFVIGHIVLWSSTKENSTGTKLYGRGCHKSGHIFSPSGQIPPPHSNAGLESYPTKSFVGSSGRRPCSWWRWQKWQHGSLRQIRNIHVNGPPRQ